MLKRLFILFLVIVSAQYASAAAAPPSKIPFEGQMDAPEFPAGVDWLNTEKPLTLQALRGKVVLLDFWTYCCINCMHILPDLKKLEKKYSKELVVIGVHSAKFDNEKETENIRQAIRRYEIEHPVINDAAFKVWKSYRVRAWPSLMLINPQGRIIGAHSGEGIFDLFDQIIGDTVRYFDAQKKIDRTPITFRLERGPASMLSYPGKIVGDEKSGRIVFSDSNHNRIIVAALDGTVLEIAGSGEAGLEDGSFEKARFFRPQGLCLDSGGQFIYVADTENHAIRRIDLKERKVTRIAGTGKQGTPFLKSQGEVGLNSPWDVIQVGSDLFIAMAGPHQLWKLDLKSGEASVYAGTGREDITDGLLKLSALAQPSGLATDGSKLYFADSEVSAVRSADLDETGRVETLIGSGLFHFGDVDGPFSKARLQHPLGVAFHQGHVYVADTYNHKIKRLDPKTREIMTVVGTGKSGFQDGDFEKAQLNEPSGLCFVGDRMFIADANNHLIRIADLKSRKVSTLEWKGLEKMVASRETTAPLPSSKIQEQKVSPGASELQLELILPRGTKINSAAKSKVKILSNKGEAVQFEGNEWPIENQRVRLPAKFKEGKGNLELSLRIFYCDIASAGRCYFDEVQLEVPLKVEANGSSEPKFSYAVARD